MDDQAWLRQMVPALDEVSRTLTLIFPEGTDRRAWLTNANAARAVFVMLHCAAIEGSDRWIAPKAVVEMSDQQAAQADLSARMGYLERIHKPGEKAQGQPWLATNSREGIRDEALRSLVSVGAVLERSLPKSSSKGRYGLRRDFVALFEPKISVDDRTSRITTWRDRHLSRNELARARIRAAQASGIVRLPDGTSVALSPGPSTVIVAGLIEVFAPRFLREPAVLAYTDGAAPGGRAVSAQLSGDLGFELRPGDPLPDLFMVDLAKPMRFVFAEAVASDGPIDAARRDSLRAWLSGAGYPPDDAFFVTAYLDRANAAFRRTVGEIAWQSVIWFVSEPDRLLIASDGRGVESLREIPGWR